MDETTDPTIDRGSILLVDDDSAFCTALAHGVHRRGYQPIIARNGEEALAEAAAWKPARAVIDLRMPGIGGLELVSILRERYPNLQVVVLTGYGSIATAVEAIKLGAVHYLTKPAEIGEILAAFDRAEPTRLDSSHGTQASSLEEVEWEHLQRVLTDSGGNISETARRLGIHRRSLQRKLSRGRGTRAADKG